MARTHGRDPAIANAIADVAGAAQRLVDGRIELLRLEAREDMRRLLSAIAYGGAALMTVSVAVVTAAATIAYTLAVWLPIGAALGVVAAVSGGAAIVLIRRSRARLPGPRVRLAALPVHSAVASEES